MMMEPRSSVTVVSVGVNVQGVMTQHTYPAMIP